MGLFDKPEVVILKETSDAKEYLEKLEELNRLVPEKSDFSQKLEKEIAITKAGIAGEDQIMFELKNSGMDLVVLHDIYLEDEDGNGAQIDYLVITPYINLFIECKNLFGNIEINNKGDFIRTMQFGKKFVKEGIYSPITQNERHLLVYKKAVSAKKGFLMGAFWNMNFDSYNKSLVVLANPKTVVNDRYAPANIKKQVIRADQLISTIKSMKSDLKSNKKEMLAIGERILAMNKDERKDYFAKFEEIKKEYEGFKNDAETKSEDGALENNAAKKNTESESVYSDEKNKNDIMLCPKCGAEMVLRTAKKGDNVGKRFWGCSAFPKCRYVKDLEQ